MMRVIDTMITTMVVQTIIGVVKVSDGRCVHAACVQVRGCWTATWALGGRHLELASLRGVSQAIIICSPSSFPTGQIIIGDYH